VVAACASDTFVLTLCHKGCFSGVSSRRRSASARGDTPEALIAALARAVLREASGFHPYQRLEAGVRQFAAWRGIDEGRHILIAVARHLAAIHRPNVPCLQTADIVRRLTPGGELHLAADAS
jgi:hypothetical protein